MFTRETESVMSLTRFRSNLYQRERERTGDGVGDEKSAPPRERKRTREQPIEDEKERERGREGGSGRHRLESRGFKIVPFFCCLSVRVFLWGDEFVVFLHVSVDKYT